MEVDLAEPVVVLVLAAFEPAYGQPSAAQPDHVGCRDGSRRADRDVVDGDSVSRARHRMDDDVPGRVDVEIGVVTRDGRVGHDQVHVGTPSQRVSARLQQP